MRGKEADKYGERETTKNADFYLSYTPVQNFCARQVSAFKEGVLHKRKNTTLIPDHSLLVGLTLESFSIQSCSPDGKYGLKPLFDIHIFTNGKMF